MRKYIGKRLLHLIPVMILISIAIFYIMELMPGDAVQAYLGVGSGVSPAQIAAMKAQLGLDGNVVERYLAWAGRILQGDFGSSILRRAPVAFPVDVWVKRVMEYFYLKLFRDDLSFCYIYSCRY